jgi:hypothetical protein
VPAFYEAPLHACWATGPNLVDLRPAVGLPLECYSEARIREFEDTTAVDERTRATVLRGLS